MARLEPEFRRASLLGRVRGLAGLLGGRGRRGERLRAKARCEVEVQTFADRGRFSDGVHIPKVVKSALLKTAAAGADQYEA